MIYALNRSTLITAVALFAVITICGLIVVGQIGSAADVWARRGLVVLALDALVAALCVPRVFAIFHAVTLARLWWFPRLDGEWSAELRSNWPRIRRTFEAARARRAVFDALADPLTEDEAEAGLIQARVTIRSSLLVVSIELEPLGSSRISRSRFVRAQWLKPALPELAYLYEQIDAGIVAPTDGRRHFGAGVVVYDKERDEITGEYWTQRREDAGFNTAGTITMRRAG